LYIDVRINNNKPTHAMKDLLRIKIWVYDFDGSKSNRTEIGYFKSIEEAKQEGWKVEVQ